MYEVRGAKGRATTWHDLALEARYGYHNRVEQQDEGSGASGIQGTLRGRPLLIA